MFDPGRRLIEQVADAIDRNAPKSLTTADDLTLWAKRRYDQAFLLLDDDGKSMPLSPDQRRRAVSKVVERRRG